MRLSITNPSKSVMNIICALSIYTICVQESLISYMVVHPSHSEDDHFLLFVASVLLTDEPYTGSELIVTVWTRQQILG